MIIDGLLMFTGTRFGATAPPASTLALGGSGFASMDSPTTGTQASSNIIDLHLNGIPILAAGQGARDLGVGDDPALKLVVWVTATFGGGTSMQIALQGAPDNGSGAPGTFVNWWLSPVYTEAQLTLGTRLYDMDMPRPPAGVSVPRFLQLSYINAGTHTAGALEAMIVIDRFDQMYNATDNSRLGGYPPGVVVAN